MRQTISQVVEQSDRRTGQRPCVAARLRGLWGLVLSAASLAISPEIALGQALPTDAAQPPAPKDRYLIKIPVAVPTAPEAETSGRGSTATPAGEPTPEESEPRPQPRATNTAKPPATTPATTDTTQTSTTQIAAAPDVVAGGRLLLFFLPDTPRWAGREPSAGPFFESLQPVASVALASVPRGTTIEFDLANASIFTAGLASLNELDGAWRVQAVLDNNMEEPGALAPGNLFSQPKRVEFASDQSDEVMLELDAVRPDDPLPSVDGVVWIERRSALLSEFRRRDAFIRAGVVLPFGYDDLSFPRRIWPTIYCIGAFGETHRTAALAAQALRDASARGAVPQAVWVFLDPSTPWGHGGFCDSETNGPLGQALIEEFIPYLEERFRVVSRVEARLVSGHSSGGWTAVHLGVTYPNIFGGVFASAPDPLDFSAFQMTDLVRDRNLFVQRDGTETPSYRRLIGPREDRVAMTVRDEVASERAIDPSGQSGGQWAAWDAMWSPFDVERRGPMALCDGESGEINPAVVEQWLRYDIARKLERNPETIAPLFRERIRILCGTRDSFYLDRAVARLKARLAAISTDSPAKQADSREATSREVISRGAEHGYIELLPDLTHDTVYPVAQLRFASEMTAHLRRHGLADELPAGGPDARLAPATANDAVLGRDATPSQQPR